MGKPTRRFLVVLVILLALAAVVWLGRDWLIAKAYLLVLESDDRVRGLRIERVIETLQVEPGDRVADIGAGTGLFSRPLARAVGEAGVIYAVDVNRELLEHIDRTAREEGIENIRTILAAEDDPRLPEAVDLVFICDTLHHIDGPGEYLGTLRGYLRPAGRVAVIDFREGASPHVSSSLRYSLEQLEEWMELAGYEPAGAHDFIDDNFFLIYECASCPGPVVEEARDGRYRVDGSALSLSP